MYSYPMHPKDADSHRQHVSGTYRDHGLIPQEFGNGHARPCGLSLYFSTSGCHWSLASDASCTNSPHVHFLHGIGSHQDQSATRQDCHPCPLLCCHQVCNQSELVLDHVSRCASLRNGEYWCPKHRAAERSASVGTARLLKCLHYPAELCKRVHTKVHEKALWPGTKRVLQKLGSTRQRRTSLSSSPSQSSSTMPYELCTMSSSPSQSSSTMPDRLCEHGSTGFRPTPELHGTQLSELPAAEFTCAELCAEGYSAEVTADDPFAKIPYGPSNNTSSLSGVEPPLSIAPGSEDRILGLDSAMTESDAFGDISITLRLPTHYSGQHAFPNTDRPSTGVDPQQGYNSLVSPMSPVSQPSPVSKNPFPSSQGDVRSSINKSGVPNPRRLSDHFSSRVVFPLTSNESACSTCGSTVTSQHGSAGFAQPANECIADGHGSYSDYSTVPVSSNSSPKRCPFPPGQSEEDIAEKRSYPTLITDLTPRVNAENAYSMDGLLQNSLPLRGEEWLMSYPRSRSSSNADAVTRDDTPSDGQLVATPERYHWPISFDESSSTTPDIQTVDKTTQSTTPAQGLIHDSSIATSVIAGTERRLSAGKLPTLFDVMCDVINGAEAHPSNMTRSSHKASKDATETVFLTESGVLRKPQDPYVEYCMEQIRSLRDLLQGSPGCQEVDNDLVAETKGQESRRGGGAQWHVQRLDCHPNINWDHSSPEYISPMDTISPSSSFGTTSPTESAGLCSLPATPSTQGSGHGTKRWRYDDTSPSSYDTPPDFDSINPRVAASTPPRNPSQQDQVSSDYLKCTFNDCKARFKGRSKHGPSNLRKHIRITHANPPVILDCPYSGCTSTFNRQYNLRSHWRTFHKDRPEAELGLPVVTQKRRERGKAERIAGDMMDVRH